VVREHGPLPLHVSTQASVLNTAAALAWKELGAVRVVLGREVTIAEAARIQQEAGIEIEMFVHGAMCMAYSGHCVISNFTQGRDSNRGGCAHSCRFSYEIDFGKGDKTSSYFMSSKDLEGLAVLPKFVAAGIVSLKVEGRMKSPLYAATTTRVYRMALDHWKEHESWENAPWESWQAELRRLPHRDATTASLLEPAGADSVHDQRDDLKAEWGMAGVVLSASPVRGILLECRQTFTRHARLEALPFRGPALPLRALEMCGPDFQTVEKSRPSSLLRLPWSEGAAAGQIVRVALT
jgi:putative protease